MGVDFCVEEDACAMYSLCSVSHSNLQRNLVQRRQCDNPYFCSVSCQVHQHPRMKVISTQPLIRDMEGRRMVDGELGRTLAI